MTPRNSLKGRKKSEKQGRRAEILSLWYLRCKGYYLISARYKCPVGEADLVMKTGHTLVFVEVKWRKSIDQAIESLRKKQRQRIEAAAKFFLAKNHTLQDCSVRFDVIALAPRRLPRHIKGAWRPAA